MRNRGNQKRQLTTVADDPLEAVEPRNRKLRGRKRKRGFGEKLF